MRFRRNIREVPTCWRLPYVCAILTLFLMSAVGALAQAPAAVNRLVVATTGEAPTMDPHMQSERSGYNMQGQAIEQLVRRNRNAELVPALALSWEPLNDTTWRFHLRDNVRFHNGNLLTAEAVKWSLERITNPEQNSPNAGNLRAITGVEIIDSLTVDIHTAYPSATLPASLALAAGIIDPAAVMGDSKRTLTSEEVVGTGPFRLVEWQRDNFARFIRFDDYWGGASEVEELVLRPMPDVNARLFALQSGEVNVMQDVPPDLVPIIAADASLRITAAPSVRVHEVTIRTESAPLNDKRVRQAMNYAVDKQTMIDGLLNGYGRLLSQPVTPEFFGYNPNLEPYPYDPGKARALLSEAGYPDGFEVEFYIYPAVRAAAETIAAYLKDVGINVKFRINEYSVTYQDFITQKGGQLHYSTWGAYSLFDADGTLPHVFREGALWSYYNDPRVDELTDIGATTLDPAARLAAYQEAMAILREEAPWIYLWQQFEIHATSSAVSWEASPDNLLIFYDYQ